MILSNKIVLLDLFSGTGGFAKGLTDAGFNIKKHYFSEIDKYCIGNYKINFPYALNLGEIQKIKSNSIERPDIVTFGFPCQDLSLAGKRKGLFGKRSSLFFEAVRLIKETRPRFFIFENVKGVFSSNQGKDFEIILQTIANLGLYDCQWQLLNSAWFLPQNRQRLYFVGCLRGEARPEIFPFIESFEGITEKNESFRKKESINNQRRPKFSLNIPESTAKGFSKALHGDALNLSFPNSVTKNGRVGRKTAHTLLTATAQHTFDKGKVRRITPVECERLQGFPDNWTLYGRNEKGDYINSDTQRFKMLGNAVTVPVVIAIAKRILGLHKRLIQKKLEIMEANDERIKRSTEIVLGDTDEINIPEITIQYKRGSENKFDVIINSSEKTVEILNQIYPKGEIDLQEQFIVLYLNRQNKVLGYYRHSKGGITATVVDIHLIISVAVKSSCTAMILSHNHPSGNLKPSQQDRSITEKIKSAAKFFDIDVLDHIIITAEGYYSFADEGDLGFVGRKEINPETGGNFLDGRERMDTLKENDSHKNNEAISLIRKCIGLNNKTKSKQQIGALKSAVEDFVRANKENINLKLLKALGGFEKQLSAIHKKMVLPVLFKFSNQDLENYNKIINTAGSIPTTSKEKVLKRVTVGVMSVQEARNAKFIEVPLDGEWLKLIGKMCLPTSFLVYGLGGSRKTSFVLLFTQYLATLGYKVLYVAREQYNTPTFTELLNLLNINVGDNFQIVKDLKVLNPKDFDFVVLDSKDDMEIGLNQFTKLKEKYPTQSFILISQATKNGNFTGSGRWRNVVDVMLLAEKGIIRSGIDKNRWGGNSTINVLNN